MRSSFNTNPQITETIDEIVNHHYFNQKINELLQNKNVGGKFGGADGLLDDQYYVSEDQIINELGTVVSELVNQQVRTIMNTEFINVEQEIAAIKEQMFTFTEEQHKLTEKLKREMFRMSEQLKRKTMVHSAMTSSVNGPSSITTSTGIRFVRNSQKHADLIGQLPQSNDRKSYHSELVEMRRQIEKLSESIEKSEGFQLLRDQLNEYKLQNKLLVESLNQKIKKLVEQPKPKRMIPTNDKPSPNLNSDNIKEYIQSSIKRSLKAMSSVYGSYADEISEMRAGLENLTEQFDKTKNQHTQYFSSQLKSVWMVLNDLKRNVDSIVERNNLDMSMQML